MKKYLSFIITFILFPTLYGQINPTGIPFITNYSPQQYGASDQNWAIVEDQRGVMYFGNNDNGVLEYDGVTWRKIPISNNSIVRSMAIDSSGTIYVGAVDEIGYLAPDRVGKLTYVSLIPSLDSTVRDFSDIFKTYTIDSLIYFCSRNKIIIYNSFDKEIKSIPLSVGGFFSFLIDKNLYNGDFLEGLKILSNDSFQLVPGGDHFAKKGIYTLDKTTHNLIVGTFPAGLFKLKPDGTFDESLSNTEANQYLKTNQLYYSKKLNKNALAYSTLSKGLIITDTLGKIKLLIDKELGVQDETVIVSNTNNTSTEPALWLGLNKGITKVEINSPIRKFGDESGIEGAINDIAEYENQIYVATNFGVYFSYQTEDNRIKFKQLEGIDALTWSLLVTNINNQNLLLAGTDKGLFTISNKNRVKYVDPLIRKKGELDLINSITKLYQPNLSEPEIYIGKSNGIFTVIYANGSWQRKASFKVKDISVRNIHEDLDKNIWIGTWFSGIVKISPANDTLIEYFDESKGLSSIKDICFFNFNKNLFVGTETGVYQFQKENETFIKNLKFEKAFLKPKTGILKVTPVAENEIWFSAFQNNEKWVEKIIIDENNDIHNQSRELLRLPNEQFDALCKSTQGMIWLGSSSGLYSFDKSKVQKADKSFPSLIRKVQTRGDSVLFYGFQKPDSHPYNYELDYEYNDISFEFAAPFFIEENKTLYKYYLKGYKDEWSNWNTQTQAVFTNLSEGDYTFMVKAKNIYGVESSIANYNFTILPPWYRTLWAYFLYAIIASFVIWIIVKLNTKRLKQDKIRLEGIVRERTAEIRQQKEAIEQKNIVLKEQQEEITASIMYAQHIQKAIVPSEQLALQLLKDYFLLWKPRDIVSGDFWWLGEKNGYVVVTAADCTGHGVPGAFMSMLGVSFLNEIVKQQQLTQSHEILNQLRNKVKTTLGQSGKENESKDGMDMALLVIDYNAKKAQYSGAYNPLYLIRNNELIEYKADRNPIGIYIKEKESFTQNIIDLQEGDILYVFSDGYVDQFGGDDCKKYSSKRFKQLLLSIQDKSMSEQKQILDQEIEDWRGKNNQVDDIIVLGIKI